jgi:hypothetical protein
VSVKRFSTGSITSTTPKNSKFWDQTTTIGLNAFESISAATCSGSDASITFSNIPQNYKHLQIRGINKTTSGTGNEWLTFQVNGATTNIVSRHTLLADGATVSGEAETTTQSTWFAFGSANSTASAFGVFIMDVLDYNNTDKNKTFKTFSGWDKNGTGYIALNSNLWTSTSVITSLTIIPRTNSFAQYSSFALYGIRGA